MDTFDTFGRVCALMERRGLTLNQLAKLSDISPSTLRNTKRRSGELKVETIERICAALGISLSEFFAEQNRGDPASAGGSGRDAREGALRPQSSSVSGSMAS